MPYKILTDLHTHTVASSHANSTLGENAAWAKKQGFELIAMTNHGPAMIDGAKGFTRLIYNYVDGVRILNGVEANILNTNGDIDVSHVLKKFDIIIASIHTGVEYENNFEDKIHFPETPEEMLETYTNLMEKNEVHMLGHLSRNKAFSEDVIEKIVEKAAEKRVIIEINELSFYKKQKLVNKINFILKCAKKYNAHIAVNSDAHFYTNVGDYKNAIALLEEIKFPQELIMNRTAESVLDFLGLPN